MTQGGSSGGRAEIGFGRHEPVDGLLGSGGL